MLSLGLTPAVEAAYVRTLLRSHRVRTNVQLLDLNHNLILDLTDSVEDGQVNIDSTSTVTQSATLTLFDPSRSLGLDDPTNITGSVAPNRMITASRGVWVEEADIWVDVPIFTGPVTGLSRDNDVLNVECQSKVVLAMDFFWTPLVIKKGTNKVEAIRQIMASVGETLFDLEPTTAVLAADLSLGTDVTPWESAFGISEGMGRSMYYDARGRLVCRPVLNSPVWTYRTGNGGSIKSVPQIGYSAASMQNAVRVVGGTPTKGNPVTATAVAPDTHPLSPAALGRNGKPRHIWTEVLEDTVTTTAAAQTLANSSLTSLLLESVDISYEALVIPHLEPEDVVTTVTDRLSIQHRFRTASIPLTAGGSSTLGYLSRVSKPVRNLQ